MTWFITGDIQQVDPRLDHHLLHEMENWTDQAHQEAHLNESKETISDPLANAMETPKKKDNIKACQETLELMKGEKV